MSVFISRTKSWSYQSTGLVTTHTLTFSPQPTAGRLLTAIVALSVTPSGVTSGWTRVPNSNHNGSVYLAQYTKLSDGTETSFSIIGGSFGACIQIYEWVGPIVAAPDVAANSQNGSVVNTSNTGTTAPIAKVGELVIAAFGLGTGFNIFPTFTPPPGFSPLGHQHAKAHPTFAVWDNLDVCYTIVQKSGPLSATATFSQSASGFTSDIVAYSNGISIGPSVAIVPPFLQVSQPQLYKTNAILRGARETKVLNYEVQSIAYDIYNLYFKQNDIQTALDDDLTYLHAGSSGDSPHDLSVNASFPDHETLIAAITMLDRRVQALENADYFDL